MAQTNPMSGSMGPWKVSPPHHMEKFIGEGPTKVQMLFQEGSFRVSHLDRRMTLEARDGWEIIPSFLVELLSVPLKSS